MDYDDYSTAAPEEMPSWDSSARQAATETAVACMRDYARPNLPYEQWWDDFSAHLTPQARQDYQYVDHRYITAHEVTGQAASIDESSPYIARVAVPTDDGTYIVVLSRESGGSSWHVTRIIPPEQHQS